MVPSDINLSVTDAYEIEADVLVSVVSVTDELPTSILSADPVPLMVKSVALCEILADWIITLLYMLLIDAEVIDAVVDVSVV